MTDTTLADTAVWKAPTSVQEQAMLGDRESEPKPASDLERRTGDDTELTFGLAQQVQQVIEAWKLVYRSYLEIGLIDANPFEIHTSEQACSLNSSAVVCGDLRSSPVCTLSVMHDSELGLPLDTVYAPQLDDLRAQGRQLMEVGLLADRRRDFRGTFAALLELMRYAFWEGRLTRSDIVIGVHPHHTAFYRRYFAFEEAGPLSTHPSVKHHPVVLLRLDTVAKLQLDPLPKGLAIYAANPLTAEVFDQRLRFTADVIENTIIGEYLRYKRSKRSVKLANSRRIA
jgi:hypothetical protein